ncbi:MAG: hypothetical protein ACAI34_16135, partial [Verrucomicrobium sp.]
KPLLCGQRRAFWPHLQLSPSVTLWKWQGMAQRGGLHLAVGGFYDAWPLRKPEFFETGGSIVLRLENICVYLILRSFCDLVGCNVEIDEDSFKFVRGVPATEMIDIKMKRYVFDKQSGVVIGLKSDERPPNIEEVKGLCKKAFDLEIVRLGFAGDLVLVDMRGEPAGHERLAVAIVSFIDGKLKEHYGVK